MKALKEKRVSLRSLFRRSLVILSLFALVFASCGDSGGDNGGGGGGGGGDTPDPIVITEKETYVKEIRVLKHPTMYSYEGAAPNLTGLVVEVSYWKDGKLEKRENVSDPKYFKVTPPVVVGIGPEGTSLTTLTTVRNSVNQGKGYQIEYVNDEMLVLSGPAALYIPSVLAMVTGTSFPSINGTIPKVFEDQEVDPSGLRFAAVYNAEGFHSGAATLPGSAPSGALSNAPDFPLSIAYIKTIDGNYKQTADDYTWVFDADPLKDAGLKYPALSTDPRAWYLDRDPNDPVNKIKLYYRYRGLGSTAPLYHDDYETEVTASGGANPIVPTDGTGVDPAKVNAVEVLVGTYYYVARLDFDKVAGKFRNFIADEDERDTNYHVRTTPSSVPANKEKIDWVKEMTDADVRFIVSYYTGPGGALSQETNSIGMYEYTKAFNTFDKNGNRRASNPQVVTDIPTTGSYATLPVNLITFADAQFDTWSLSLYYYYPNIDAKGDVTPGDYLGWQNAAVVTLSDFIHVYTYDHVELKPNSNLPDRIKLTQLEKATSASPSINDKAKSLAGLVDDLKTKYTPVWVYLDQNNRSAAPIEFGGPVWPEGAKSGPTTWTGQGVAPYLLTGMTGAPAAAATDPWWRTANLLIITNTDGIITTEDTDLYFGKPPSAWASTVGTYTSYAPTVTADYDDLNVEYEIMP